jgi:hypothetical protein
MHAIEVPTEGRVLSENLRGRSGRFGHNCGAARKYARVPCRTSPPPAARGGRLPSWRLISARTMLAARRYRYHGSPADTNAGNGNLIAVVRQIVEFCCRICRKIAILVS